MNAEKTKSTLQKFDDNLGNAENIERISWKFSFIQTALLLATNELKEDQLIGLSCIISDIQDDLNKISSFCFKAEDFISELKVSNQEKTSK